MKKYYVCRNCGEINYDLETIDYQPLHYYKGCKRCGHENPAGRPKTEFTFDEFIECRDVIGELMGKLAKTEYEKEYNALSQVIDIMTENLESKTSVRIVNEKVIGIHD